MDVTHPTPEIQKLMDAWEAKWPNDPFISDAVHAYDMPWVMIQVMQKAGSIDCGNGREDHGGHDHAGDLQTLEGAGYMGGGPGSA